MDADFRNGPAAYGFLTVLEDAEHGFFGGYLVLSPQGRPLEFRCSAPVVASRAQEILYGSTLRPYLFAEVIGQALVGGAELSAPVILTDRREMLSLASMRSEEVVLAEAVDDQPNHDLAAIMTPMNSEPPVVRVESGVARTGGASFTLNRCRMTVAAASMTSIDDLRAQLEPLATHIFLAEPFDRIRAALIEAQLASHDVAEDCNDRTAA